MEAALQDRGRELDAVWDEAEGLVGWAVRLPLAPAGTVYVPVVDIGRRTWRVSRATKEAVRRAAAH